MAERVEIRTVAPWKFSRLIPGSIAVMFFGALLVWGYLTYATFPPPLSDLDAKVTYLLGTVVEVQNTENADWQGCSLTINGAFDAHADLIKANYFVDLNAIDFSDSRGIRFNPDMMVLKRLDIVCARAPIERRYGSFGLGH